MDNDGTGEQDSHYGMAGLPDEGQRGRQMATRMSSLLVTVDVIREVCSGY